MGMEAVNSGCRCAQKYPKVAKDSKFAIRMVHFNREHEAVSESAIRIWGTWIANDANDYVTMFALNVEPITIHHLL